MAPLLPLLVEDPEEAKIQKLVHGYFAEGDYIKALEVIEDSISTRGKEKVPAMVHYLQGCFFYEQGTKTENSDMKFPFLLASVECFTEDCGVHAYSAIALLELGKLIGSASFYKKALNIAKEGLSFIASFGGLNLSEENTKSSLENVVLVAESMIPKLQGSVRSDSDTAATEAMIEAADSMVLLQKMSEPKLRESKNIRDSIRSDLETAAGKRLRSYWASMDVESKRNFMKVSIAKLTAYVERLYGRVGLDALDQVLDSARINRKWKFWMCRSCSLKFYYPKKFRSHLEQEHAAKFKPSTTKHMAQRVDEVWAGMISVAGWEPVDVVAAVEMIKTQLESVKEFVYENGWSKNWPLAVDEERSKLLKEIQSLLLLFQKRKILSCSIRDWMMQLTVKHLAQLEISEHNLSSKCRLVETPQSICFLECHELNQILDLLKRINCERVDGTELVSNATDSLCGRLRVKEKIEFDHEFSFMLLDKRLLRGKIASFDDEGIIDVCDHNVHYTKTHPQGDDTITWLLDYPLIDESFEFPRSIRAHNLEICVAVLRAIHFTCATLGTKYAKKLQILNYDAALIDAKNLCILEDERRKNVPEDQWNTYASLLCDKCEERLVIDAGDSHTTKLCLCAVRDVLEKASHPTFEFSDLEDCMTLIHGHKNLNDDTVLKSIDLLKSVVTNKVPVADSKILLIENSRTNLLNDLVKLSVFDYRSYILHLLKRYQRDELDEIVDMDAKTKLAAAQAEHLSEEKQEKGKKSGSNKKKNRSNKRTSASMSKDDVHESSVNLEPKVTPPSPKSTEEDSMEPEDTLSSERGRLEISSNTKSQDETAKDMENMPGEDLLSENLESAHKKVTRYNSALDMTLKALLNIKVLQEDLVHNRQLFHGNLEEQVPCALKDFFSAVVSEQIKEDELYSYLLSNLLASLEEVHSLSSDADEVVVTILEFLHWWKSPEKESLVTRLFTLEEYERMRCTKCRRNPNYPEQSSYGIVMAANSIRNLKCAFGNMKFEEILTVIRMEDEMICDVKTGGCGKTNFVHHVLSRCPPIFTIVLEWEKNETETEISETAKALAWEIDISRLYEGLEEPNTNYRLVSMIGCGEEGEHICMAYKTNRWVSLRHESLLEEGVGNWKNVVRICGERRVRPEILFYEAAYK
ncbi:Papain-like cysteine peptidase superfamily [Arabidopsis suecica]|uniref:Papain-like cysteine peptidase superfamily n=1 Tax=Arabidopsis suecica TaxID=45249 RepID=A0A8T2HH92_ARASU|nr:Papain-like cysteine peptidase superfamily [Arabidopsis suecica]